MNVLENINSINYLNVLYERLKKSLNSVNKETVDGSVLLTMTKLSSNDRFKIMANAAQRFHDVYEDDLVPLLELGFIKLSEMASKSKYYVITATGLYYVEYNNSKLDLDKILRFIQAQTMEFPSVNKPLNDKEKVIIFSMIALRNFDELSLLDLNSDEASANWVRIIKDIITPFLLRINVIDIESIFSIKAGHENPVSYVIRRLNDLPKKTKNIFVITNNNQYYLDIDVKDLDEAESQLSFLLSKLFSNISTIGEAEELKNFLCETAQSQSIFVLDNFCYINYYWDKVIKGVIDKLFLGVLS